MGNAFKQRNKNSLANSKLQKTKVHKDYDETKKILSIYGGGIRGILPCKMLQQIESRISSCEPYKVNVTDIFDLTAGTSIGGLLAMGYNVQELDENKN